MNTSNPIDPPGNTSRTTRSPKPSISTAVIHALADAEGCAPTELPSPLYEVIDPDALDALYTRASPHIHFEYTEYHVEITPDQQVLIHPRDE
jgi:Halobacterial output domain 1